MNQLREDIKNIEKECWGYKENIKLCTLEIQAELKECFKTKNTSYDKLMNGLLEDYVKILVQSLSLIKEENKNDFLKLIQALVYYKDNPKVYAHEFERIISTADFEDVQVKLQAKYSGCK